MKTNYKEIIYNANIIVSKELILRKFKPEDAQAFYAYQKEPDLFLHQGGSASESLVLQPVIP